MAARLRELGIVGVDVDRLHSVEDLGDAWAVTTFLPADVHSHTLTSATVTVRHEKAAKP
jgi:hypothetical protein